MTTGELLVEMSTLTTGTALEHFTNISFGGGGGGVVADDTTEYMEEKLLKLLFMNEDIPLIGDQDGLMGSVITGNYYIALFENDPGESGDQASEGSYEGYLRVPIVRGPTGWFYDEGVYNIVPIAWQPCISGNQTLAHYGIMDSLVGGSMLWRGELPGPVDVKPGDSIEFAYAEFKVKLY